MAIAIHKTMRILAVLLFNRSEQIQRLPGPVREHSAWECACWSGYRRDATILAKLSKMALISHGTEVRRLGILLVETFLESKSTPQELIIVEDPDGTLSEATAYSR